LKRVSGLLSDAAAGGLLLLGARESAGIALRTRSTGRRAIPRVTYAYDPLGWSGREVSNAP
jgi:hypothetical protein